VAGGRRDCSRGSSTCLAAACGRRSRRTAATCSQRRRSRPVEIPRSTAGCSCFARMRPRASCAAGSPTRAERWSPTMAACSCRVERSASRQQRRAPCAWTSSRSTRSIHRPAPCASSTAPPAISLTSRAASAAKRCSTEWRRTVPTSLPWISLRVPSDHSFRRSRRSRGGSGARRARVPQPPRDR
jgi:hypothetical protein